MGTYIHLSVGGMNVDWAKNNIGVDHGHLFQEGDVARRKSDQIDYDYYENHDDADLAMHEEGFVRPLARVLPRLDLLGHTLEAARSEYQAIVQQAGELAADEEGAEKADYMTFEEFCDFVCRYPLSDLDDTYIDYEAEDRDDRSKGRFLRYEADISRIPDVDRDNLYWSEMSFFGSRVCVLSAYAMLQVLGRNCANADAEVMWQYGPIVTSGWVSADNFRSGARRDQKVLVATEGTSDSRVLRHALDLLRPDIRDFFRFIDADERHPFWGTGNLVKFAEGLVRIDVQNKVLFLLDNDLEGVEALNRIRDLGLPTNMRVMRLPNISHFENFRTRGPGGNGLDDINGRAAAIECYLDLELAGYPPAQVRWNNYKREFDAWHGVLEHKESYMRRFLDQTEDDISSGRYDASNLVMVLDALVAETVELSALELSLTKAKEHS